MVILGILVIFGVISVACVQIVFVWLLFAMRLMPGCKLPLECIQVGVRAEIHQLACDFRLLGLLTAAPHGVDPLYFGRVRTSGALGVQNVSWEHHT